MFRHLFGPVPSRRLGVSLGVDLVKAKSCNLDCVFCECGKTDALCEKRERFKDPAEIKEELREVLGGMTPDYVTFSGAGEPTLSLDLGEIIRWVKGHYPVKVAVITNGLLFSDPEVRKELAAADLVLTKINSVHRDTFDKICRGKPFDLEAFMENMRNFCAKFPGKIHLETFIIEGLNDGTREILDLTAYVKTLRIEKWQLNTLARAGAEDWVTPASRQTMERLLKEIIGTGYPADRVEIIGEVREIEGKIEMNEELLKNMREKREYRKEEIEKIFK